MPRRELRLVFRVPFRVTDERGCGQGRGNRLPRFQVIQAEISVDARLKVTA
jgi:hypothetical protein